MTPGSGKRIVGTVLFSTALAVTLGFVFLLFADAQNLDDVPGTGALGPVAVAAAVALVVIALLMILLLILRRLDRRRKAAEEAEAYFIPEPDRLAQEQERRAAFDRSFKGIPLGPAPTPPESPYYVYHLPDVPIARKAWGEAEPGTRGAKYPFYFPRSADKGLYVNDYVDIGGGDQLKLRTLLAGAEKFSATQQEETPAPAEPAGTGPGRLETSGELPGESFVKELEKAQAPTEEEPVPERPEVFYDFPGDIHDVLDVEGIGVVYAKKLKDVGVETTARLCYEDASDLASKVGVPEKTVRTWQHMAELMKVSGIGKQYAEALARAGIEGIDELKRRKASAIADQVNAYLETLESNVLGQRITEKRVEGWQEKAKSMRRVRQSVPER